MSEIESFVYGGQTSRFWVLKNYINMQKASKKSHLAD